MLKLNFQLSTLQKFQKVSRVLYKNLTTYSSGCTHAKNMKRMPAARAQLHSRNFAQEVKPPELPKDNHSVTPTPSANIRLDVGQTLRRPRLNMNVGAGPTIPKKMTVMEGFREFFWHPLTWEKNNGFLNIILGLTIFGYCFFAATRTDSQNVSYQQDTKKATTKQVKNE